MEPIRYATLVQYATLETYPAFWSGDDAKNDKQHVHKDINNCSFFVVDEMLMKTQLNGVQKKVVQITEVNELLFIF